MTREEAIDRLTYLMSDLNEFCIINESKHMSDDDREEMESIEMAIKALEQTRWVPVRERLPEPGLTVRNITKYYLVQGEYGDMFVACYDGDKWQQIFNYDREIEEKVVAWMELPERYEPKEG